MKKRAVSFLLIFTILFSFCSCSKYAPVSVNGAKIGKGIYIYFEDCAKQGNSSEADIKVQTNRLISRYVAINTEFAERGLTLSVDRKTELSEEVNIYWQYYSKYYENLGVSKQDYYKIKQSEYYKQCLMEYYYSENGESPVTDSELREYFNENFVAFRAVTSFLTTVDENNNTVYLPSSQRKKIAASFKKMADEINSGKASLEVVAAYYENTSITNETVVISKDSTDYPEGFFENVKKLKNDKAGSFVIGDYIFAVQRNDINSDELNLFMKYKLQCLQALKGEEFDGVVDSWSKLYLVEG